MIPYSGRHLLRSLGYLAAKKLDKALPLFEQTLEKREAKLGPNHPDTLATMSSLGKAYTKSGQADKAADLFQELVSQVRKSLPKNSPQRSGWLA